MRPIRVVVANRPRLMRELLLSTITEQPDIVIVAEIQDEEQIPTVVDGTRPDFLIVALGDSDQLPQDYGALLRRHPDMKILAVAPERNSSVFYWGSFDIHAKPVEASEAGILETLRCKSEFAVGGQA
jgi:DNA-binding NarL/FixJ family response regulator